jgi:hypothetical protein
VQAAGDVFDQQLANLVLELGKPAEEPNRLKEIFSQKNRRFFLLQMHRAI